MKSLNMKCNFNQFFLFIFASLIVGIIIFNVPKGLDAEEIKQFNVDPKNYNVKLQILNQNNQLVTEFLVAIADNEYKKMYGLMNLDKLPENFGMIFYFNKSDIVTMWMKNTKISLDMIFIDENGFIADIKHEAVPYDLTVISSKVPVKQALEINGGISKKLGIVIGQKIRILQ